MNRLRTIKSKIQYRIKRSKDNVFILDDFDDLSGKDQVGRALRNLIKEGSLVKIGQGVYAKTRYSELFDKNVLIKALPILATEALNKLGVITALTSYEHLYNNGTSTQVPTGNVIGVKKRVSRTIAFDGWKMTYERISR